LTSVNGTFKNTRRIRDLNLSYNRITTITDAFTSLTSLKKLSLKYNLLTHVPDDTFNDNVELLQIDMDANNIQWIGRTTFQRLSTVTDFRVRNNNLISLNGSVRPLLSIKYFDAAFNEIGYLEKGEFERNKFLEFISLMGNNISNVEGAFTGAVSLKGLGLAGNHIERIRRGDFPQDMKATPQVILDLVLVAFLALSAMYLYFERQLKEWLHSRGIFGCLQCLVEDVDPEQLFDVFLSFSSKDAAWVHEQILPKIETMGFSYCTYERNFKGGFLMHDIIREAVACSRRTLLILTK
ncbi:hypothetical protein V5799_002974, partial [Amblyomma americanum]